ncbi:unnamed protein product [Diamesa serratosioi]
MLANKISNGIGAAVGALAALALFMYNRYHMHRQIEYGPRGPGAAPIPEPIPRPLAERIPEPVVNPVDFGNCVICIKLMRRTQAIKTLHCNHMLHMLCYRRLLKNNERTCPICRSIF